MKKTVSICSAICMVTLFGHYVVYSQSRISDLEMTLEISNQKHTIANDQIRDLMYVVRDQSNTNNYEKQSGFVAGLLEGVQKKDHYMTIWHDGYNRGGEVLDMMDSGIIPVKSTEGSNEKYRDQAEDNGK